MIRAFPPARAVVAVLAGAILLAACGRDPGPAADDPFPQRPMSRADAAKVDASVREVWNGTNRRDLPGLWVGVWDAERGVFVRGYGEAAPGRPATPADHTRIGDITQSMTATIVLDQVEAGRFGLDDPLIEIDPKIETERPAFTRITVRQLLGMTSGLPDYFDRPDGVALKWSARPSYVFSPDELVNIGTGSGIAAPGTAIASGTNFIVLQQLLVDLTGRTMRELVAETVSRPLGLTETGLPPADATALRRPAARSVLTEVCAEEIGKIGGTVEPGTDVTDRSASYGQGSGGVNSTVGDLGRWAWGFSGNELLPESLVEVRGGLPGYEGWVLG
ncbi:MAG: serine hydrolase domain-containing protein, partial [Actinomycetota bacterium]